MSAALPSTFNVTSVLDVESLSCCVCGAGFLALGEWQLYSQALETFLRHVATHCTLSKSSAVETFLTSTDVSKTRSLLPRTLVTRTRENIKLLQRNLMPF